MFDAIIQEISQRFGLGDKGQALIASLLALIFDKNSGGIAGLLEKFKQQGLGDVFTSWLGGASATPVAIGTQQVENVLGSSAVNGIASRLGLAPDTVLAAASAALPKIIGAVTPNGQLPSAIPAGVGGLLSNLSDVGGAAASSAAATATRVTSAAEDAAAGGLGWLKWLVLAAIILILGYCVMNRSATAPSPSATAPTKQTTPAVTQNAVTDAKAALLALVPGKYTAADLVKALNLMTIHFDTGATNISADSVDLLTAAAAAIKAAPAGTRVEIGGHTDNTGDPASNLQLSDARANTVRNKLIELGVSADALTAKGYGDSKPIADNASDEGKAKNRRMEFTVLQ
jgi:outer membrane protein OmpA-like peptidoglycan-associated protein/uncharacterized protein YidB (DUF937 family)